MGGVINTITTNTITYLLASTAFAVCDSAAYEGSKTATIYDVQNTNTAASFSLMNGVTVQVLFSQSNTANNPTLNINGTGAVPLCLTADLTTGRVGTDVMHSWPSKALISLTYTIINEDGQNVPIWLLNDANVDTALTTSAGSAERNNTQLYLIGAEQQDEYNTGVFTYTNEGVYIGQDNKLYSQSSQVVTVNTPGYADLGTAAYFAVNQVDINNTSIDIFDADNDTIPTSEMVANTIQENINKVTQASIGINETADDPEQQPDFTGYSHSILISKDHSSSSVIDQTYKPVDLTYNPNQRELVLSNASVNPITLQTTKITNNQIVFNSNQFTSSLDCNMLVLRDGEDGEEGTISTFIGVYDSQFTCDTIFNGTTYFGNQVTVDDNLEVQGNTLLNTLSVNSLTTDGLISSSNEINVSTDLQQSEDMIKLYSSAPRYETNIGNRYIQLRNSGVNNTAPSSNNITESTILGPQGIYVTDGWNTYSTTQGILTKNNLQFKNNSGTYTLTADKIQFLNTLQTTIKTSDGTNWGTRNINIIPDSLGAFNLVYAGNFVQINIRFTTTDDVSLEDPGTYLLFTVNNGFKCMSTLYGNIYRYSPPYVDSQVCVFFNANDGNIYANNLAPDTTYNINFTYIATD